jgi:hypothetical protein
MLVVLLCLLFRKTNSIGHVYMTIGGYIYIPSSANQQGNRRQHQHEQQPTSQPSARAIAILHPPDKVNKKCKFPYLVHFGIGFQFLTVYSGRAAWIPLNRDHGKNRNPFVQYSFYFALYSIS